MQQLIADLFDTVWPKVESWLSQSQIYMLFGPPGTGKTRHGSELCFGKRTVVDGIVLESSHEKCVAGYFNVSMKMEAVARNPFAPIKTLDGLVQSVIARSREWQLYRRPRRDKKGEIVGWVNPPESIEMLRAEICQRYRIEYSVDPYVVARGNRIFHVFDFFINAYPVPSLNEVMYELEKLYRKLEIHPKAPYVAMEYVDYLLRRRYVDFVLGRRLVWRLGLKYVHCARSGKNKDCWVPDAVFLDEAQDLSPLFWLVVTVMFPRVNVVIVTADDDQQVYDSLHGADVRYLLNIARDLKEGKLRGPPPIVLRQSHRVAEPVAAFAREVISRVKDRWPKEWVGRDVVAGVRTISARDAMDLITRLAEIYESEIRNLSTPLRDPKDQEKLEHNSMFVLTSTNSEVFEWSLRVLSVGYVPASLKENMHPTIRAALKALAEGKNLPRDLEVSRALEEFKEALRKRGHDPVQYTKKVLRMAEHGISPIYVDTAYAAKGLQAEVVFVVNYTRHREAVGRIRPFYVALTRAFTNVYIIEKPHASYYTWVEI